ncbi:MAG: SDR family NAD(P)-dependent oxidoreductase [Luminiphilus sp.]|jgi:NAD(P)-dependent dehydrogenase (short-subunit alcohol dehydrogenase family)|nr:SDR family NAD(P)-dependent oxidoreductase [Luminiphilus sp.]
MYSIDEFTPWQCLVLTGKSRWFTVKDVITFEPVGHSSTRITYTAHFEYRYGLEAIASRNETALRKMGKASLRGLAKALADDNPSPSALPETKRKDSNLIAALRCFTRYGYSRGRKLWRPMSTDISGKHIVLTGASSGLGYSAAVSLLEAGADLTLIIRDKTKIESMQASLEQATGRCASAVELADLSLLSDVRALADKLHAQAKPIDVLINNAGALFNDFAETQEGIERSVALLLLSPWKLTELLLPLMTGHDATARVINVVSGGMYTQKLKLNQLMMEAEHYKGSVAYARAKRALTVLTELWSEQWREDNIVVNSMHPGWADTPGVQSALPGFRRLTQRVLRSAEEGADTIVWLARASEAGLVSGKLFLDREPRTTHLQSATTESTEERMQLIPWLNRTYENVSTN